MESNKRPVEERLKKWGQEVNILRLLRQIWTIIDFLFLASILMLILDNPGPREERHKILISGLCFTILATKLYPVVSIAQNDYSRRHDADLLIHDLLIEWSTIRKDDEGYQFLPLDIMSEEVKYGVAYRLLERIKSAEKEHKL